MDRLLTAGLCGNTIEQDIQTRGDSRVSGYPGLSPKIQDLLLLHIDDWTVYMKFIIKCICQSEVRASVGGSWREKTAVHHFNAHENSVMMMRTGHGIKTFGAFLKTFSPPLAPPLIQTLIHHSSTSNMAFHLKDVCSSNFTWPLNMMLT